MDENEISILIQTAVHEQTDDRMQENELTAEQFTEIMLRHIGPMELNDELRRIFDRNHDGRITREDFDKLDDEQYQLIVKELSNCENEGIDFNQFVNLMMNQ